jgi:hypothetical protein
MAFISPLPGIHQAADDFRCPPQIIDDIIGGDLMASFHLGSIASACEDVRRSHLPAHFNVTEFIPNYKTMSRVKVKFLGGSFNQTGARLAAQTLIVSGLWGQK